MYMTRHCDYFQNYTRGYAYQGVLCEVGQGFSKTKIYPLHPNISMHILHTVLYTNPKVLTRRICLTIKNL